jgi:hypothetical protein
MRPGLYTCRALLRGLGGGAGQGGGVVGGLGASHLCAEKPEMFDQEMLRVLHETYPQVS